VITGSENDAFFAGLHLAKPRQTYWKSCGSYITNLLSADVLLNGDYLSIVGEQLNSTPLQHSSYQLIGSS